MYRTIASIPGKRFHKGVKEATFHISDWVRMQNCRIWSTEKPDEVQEYWDRSPKINVWSSDRIIMSYFFEENVNGNNYLEMLKEFLDR